MVPFFGGWGFALLLFLVYFDLIFLLFICMWIVLLFPRESRCIRLIPQRLIFFLWRSSCVRMNIVYSPTAQSFTGRTTWHKPTTGNIGSLMCCIVAVKYRDFLILKVKRISSILQHVCFVQVGFISSCLTCYSGRLKKKKETLNSFQGDTGW